MSSGNLCYVPFSCCKDLQAHWVFEPDFKSRQAGSVKCESMEYYLQNWSVIQWKKYMQINNDMFDIQKVLFQYSYFLDTLACHP